MDGGSDGGASPSRRLRGCSQGRSDSLQTDQQDPARQRQEVQREGNQDYHTTLLSIYVVIQAP